MKLAYVGNNVFRVVDILENSSATYSRYFLYLIEVTNSFNIKKLLRLFLQKKCLQKIF